MHKQERVIHHRYTGFAFFKLEYAVNKYIKIICKLLRPTKLFFLISSFVLLAGCSTSKTDPAMVYRNQTSAQIFQGGEQALAHRSYNSAVKHFEAIDTLYPFCPYAEQNDLYLIYAYYRNDDAPSAEAAADKFTRLYPRSEHVDYAYYMKGLSDFNQNRGWVERFVPVDLSQRDPAGARRAFDDFGILVRLYPTSYYAADAHQHMIYLRNLFAAYELHIAKYYLRRAAYVASANRANYIVQHYDGTPAVQEALGILVVSYNKLSLPELSNQALAVLQINYPNGYVLQNLARGRPMA